MQVDDQAGDLAHGGVVVLEETNENSSVLLTLDDGGQTKLSESLGGRLSRFNRLMRGVSRCCRSRCRNTHRIDPTRNVNLDQGSLGCDL
jgi:hypothetical protein